MELKFRTALNGFNRLDVVNFIEACTTSHQQEIRKYQDENTQLRTELENVCGMTSNDHTPSETLQQLQNERAELLAELDRTRAELDHARQSSPSAEMQDLQAENEALRAELTQLRGAPDHGGPDSAAELQDLHEKNEALCEELAQVRAELGLAKQESAAEVQSLQIGRAHV